MADLNSIPQTLGEGNFVSELNNVREQIKKIFSELINLMKARECELLTELDNLLTSFHVYQSELRKPSEKTSVENEIHNNASNLNNTLSYNSQTKLQGIKSELESIESRNEPKMVRFVCVKSKLLSGIKKFGKLVEEFGNINYEQRTKSILSFCRRGSEIEQLNYPWGITIDHRTGNIYVADQFNHSIKVYANTGKFLFRFGDSYGEGRMEYPKCLVIYEDRLLITHEILSLHSSNYNILNYQLSGKFILKIGSSGKGKLEFNFPCGIACNDSNGDIFVCDNNNDRVQVLSKDFSFISQFGAEKLKSPLDIKLSDEYIFILDGSNPCVHLYDYNYILQESFVSRGEGMQVLKPYCFCIDNADNILISDRSSKSILIFNPEFDLDQKINTSQFPMGVVVDSLKRVIVVCRSKEDCLQIF